MFDRLRQYLSFTGEMERALQRRIIPTLHLYPTSTGHSGTQKRCNCGRDGGMDPAWREESRERRGEEGRRN